METVQLQCGHCKNVMGISVEHLGSQVQCPHCKGVVQTPPRASVPSAPAEPPLPAPNLEVNHRESIFAGSEASDAVLGAPAEPKVELPPPTFLEPAALASDADADLTKLRSRPVYDRGVVSMIAMIFLVPYAIVTTGFIVYLLFFQGSKGNPLEFLRDPAPQKEKGAPRKVMQPAHNHPLAARQKTPLGSPIEIGALMVTPERVLLTEAGDLKLFLRARNTSANLAFEPINDAWLRYEPNKPGSEPYTFLESKSREEVGNIYGAYLEYRRNSNDKAGTASGSGLIGPKEETTIVLTAAAEDWKTRITAIAKSNTGYTWRVQVRRGFVKVDGNDVSATAVIGVEFTSSQIEREGKKG